ncbi:hypothetical protein MIMGU_mgv1a023599mg [Erythranthe guttata]|uniref:MATH domain-containing protein n=1 Tax=Erythranthe guttata TaxID=4155 RepID=A0A022QGB9_ERYGU|nr:hypothetical protein MIMGU_mgv1a023599mg [Erythranthe guttata]
MYVLTTLNTREAPPSHFMIKIESFFVLEKYGIKKYETKEFVAGDCKCTIFIILLAERTLCFEATKSEWGISKFISRKVLSDPSNGYIIDDSCPFRLLTPLKIPLYPKGNVEGTGSHVSIYLYYLGTERVQTCFTVCMKNQFDDKQTRRYFFSYWFSASSSSWGRPVYIDLTNINDPNKGFIVKDCCLLNIEINVKAVARVS